MNGFDLTDVHLVKEQNTNIRIMYVNARYVNQLLLEDTNFITVLDGLIFHF